MPSEKAHIELANRNSVTISHLLTDKGANAEWIATVAFYRAVHIAEAIFATEGQHGGDHGKRHDKIKKGFKRLWSHYRLLWSLSTLARYMKQPANMGGQEFTSFSVYLGDQDVQALVVDDLLRGVETQTRAAGYLSGASCKSLGITAAKS